MSFYKNIISLKLHFLLPILILIGSYSSIFAQNSVRSGLDENTIILGDQVHLWIEIQYPTTGTTVTFPKIEPPTNIEYLGKPKIDTNKNGEITVIKQEYIVTGFDSGRFVIPAYNFSFTNADGKKTELATDTISINVQTVAVDTTQPFKPETDVLDGPQSWWEKIPILSAIGHSLQDAWSKSPAMVIGTIVAILLVIAFILWLIFAKKFKGKAKLPPEKIHEKAIRLLNELEGKNLWSTGHIKEYYSNLSEIVRAYLEAQFGISAMEQTTDELLKIAKQNQKMRKIRPELKEILTLADLAKFAKLSPDEDQHIAAMDTARLLVSKTIVIENSEEGKQS